MCAISEADAKIASSFSESICGFFASRRSIWSLYAFNSFVSRNPFIVSSGISRISGWAKDEAAIAFTARDWTLDTSA